MSGGVGLTCNDISQPREQEQELKQQKDDPSKTPLKKTTSFLSLRQLNSLALITILSASGMVYAQDIAFVIFSLLYTLFLLKFAFPKLTPSSEEEEPPVFDPKNKLLGMHVFVGAVIGLFLPIAYVFEGGKEGIKAATPHVFLLASQVFMEGVAFSGRFSIPIRVFVPVSYNAVRIGTLMEWLSNEFSKVNEEYGGNPRRLYVGRALASGVLVAGLSSQSF